VYRGASGALLTTPPIEDFYGKDGLGDFVYPDPPNPADYLKKEPAAVALVRLASQYPSMSAVASVHIDATESTDMTRHSAFFTRSHRGFPCSSPGQIIWDLALTREWSDPTGRNLS
jgi:hypothetical protein